MGLRTGKGEAVFLSWARWAFSRLSRRGFVTRKLNTFGLKWNDFKELFRDQGSDCVVSRTLDFNGEGGEMPS